MLKITGHNGLRVVWVGQILSGIGSAISSFALSIGIYRETNNVFLMSMLAWAGIAPLIYLSFFAGPVVDYAGPKRVLVYSNLLAGFFTACLLVFLIVVPTQAWLLVVFTALVSSAGAFRDIALQITVPTFVLPERFQRYNGLIAGIQAIPVVLGPSVAAIIIYLSSVSTALFVDAVSFFVAAAAVIIVQFPERGGRQLSQETLWVRTQKGIALIKDSKPLRVLVAYFASANFFNGMASGLIAIYVLRGTGGSEGALAVVNSLAAVGMLVGGLVAAALPAAVPALYILIAGAAQAISGRIAFGLAATAATWAICLFFRSAAISVSQSANDTIWQQLTAPQLRGTMFGARRVLAQGGYPLAVILGGALGSAVGHRGQGEMALIFIVFGVLELFATGLLLAPSLRELRKRATSPAASA